MSPESFLPAVAAVVQALLLMASVYIYVALVRQISGTVRWVDNMKTLAQRAWRRSSVTSPSTHTVGSRPSHCATPRLKLATE